MLQQERKQKENKHNYVKIQGNNLEDAEYILSKTECPKDLLD